MKIDNTTVNNIKILKGQMFDRIIYTLLKIFVAFLATFWWKQSLKVNDCTAPSMCPITSSSGSRQQRPSLGVSTVVAYL